MTEWLSFLLFWGLNIYIIYRGMDLLRKVENWAAPFVLIMTALLLGWAIWNAQGLGYLLKAAGHIPQPERILADLHSVADGNDWVLGDAFAQHARLHALREEPARSG